MLLQAFLLHSKNRYNIIKYKYIISVLPSTILLIVYYHINKESLLFVSKDLFFALSFNISL